MPLPYAPALPSPSISPGLPSPIVAPGISAPVPFIRPGLPTVLPIRPPIPALLPALPALGAPVAAPAAGGLARVAVRGAALLGAFGLGLAIGNEVYEEVLNRPFGPSLQDLFFPEGQPQPLPVPERKTASGQCPDNYCLYVRIIGTVSSSGDAYDTGPRPTGGGLCGNLGPVGAPYIAPGNGGFPNVFIRDARGVIVNVGNVNGITVKELRPDHFRQNGLPDTCFLPLLEPLPVPSSLPRPQRRPDEAPYLPEPLPEPEPLRVPFIPRLPDSPFVPDTPFLPGTGEPFEPQLVPPVFLIPFTPPLPRTPREPATQPELELNSDGTPRLMAPPLPGFECCPSLETKLDELLEREECEPCDLTEVERLLNEVLDTLATAGSGDLDVTPCDVSEPVSIAYGGAGFDGVFSAITAITTSLNTIHDNTKCEPEPCVSSVPDWWQVRKGADTPQLSIVFRKQGTRNYHSLNIPHPKVSPRPAVSAIEPYEGGQWQATIYLRDNSKFIVCAKLKGDAIRVATQAASMIEPEWLPSPLEIATTERRGFAVNQSLMEPRYMDYHPEGQKSRRALWRVPLA